MIGLELRHYFSCFFYVVRKLFYIFGLTLPEKFENFLGTTKSEFTNNEMINSNVPRKKNNENFSMKANMIFDNMNDNYIDRLKNLCRRYENEVSDIYKLSLINKSPKGKFKGLSIDKFSQISAESKYHRGKLKVNK